MTTPHDKALEIRDDDGKVIKPGDRINFSYGIPGVHVEGQVVDDNGVLFVLTPDHKPERCKLSELRKHVGHFWKSAEPRPNPFEFQTPTQKYKPIRGRQAHSER